MQQPQLNEKVLKDKRKKLRETFERILRLYEKENPDIFKELRKLEVEYEQKRSQLSQYFDAVKVSALVAYLLPFDYACVLQDWFFSCFSDFLCLVIMCQICTSPLWPLTPSLHVSAQCGWYLKSSTMSVG